MRRVREVVRSRAATKLTQLVDDASIQVITALSDDDVRELLILALEEARGPLSWRELKAIFQGIVGEDRLRKILSKMKAEGVVAELTRTRYSLPEYVPPEEVPKVKNLEVVRDRLPPVEAYY